MQTVDDRMTKFLLRSLDAHRSLMYCSLDNIPTYRDPVGGGGGNRVLMSSVTDRADQSRSDGASPQSGYGARFGVPPPPPQQLAGEYRSCASWI